MVLLVVAAYAQDPTELHGSELADVVFRDTYEVFDFAAVDSGWKPSASGVLAVRFRVVPTGGITTEMVTQSDLTWGPTFQHALEPIAGLGSLTVDTALELDLDVKIDISLWDGIVDVWDTGFSISDVTVFDTFAFAGGPEDVEIVIDDLANFEPFDTSISIIPTVSLDVGVDVIPEITAIYTTDQIETRMGAQTGELLADGTWVEFDLPEAPIAEVELVSTLDGGLYTLFELVVVPSIELDTLIGDFELASFDIPVELLDLFSFRTFEPVTYTHPLPALTPIEVGDAGTLLVGDQVNLSVPLENLGLLAMEGTARIEGGGGFSVYPAYYAATEGNAAGVTITFAPTSAGDKIAFLVLQTNDPTAGELRIPLHGVARDPAAEVSTPIPPTNVDGRGGVNGEEVKGCGCQVQPSSLSWGLLALLGPLLVRRRR